MIEDVVTTNDQFGIEVSLWAPKGTPISLLLRPDDWQSHLHEGGDPFIEIPFEEIDSFKTLLDKLGKLKYGGGEK